MSSSSLLILPASFTQHLPALLRSVPGEGIRPPAFKELLVEEEMEGGHETEVLPKRAEKERPA